MIYIKIRHLKSILLQDIYHYSYFNDWKCGDFKSFNVLILNRTYFTIRYVKNSLLHNTYYPFCKMGSLPVSVQIIYSFVYGIPLSLQRILVRSFAQCPPANTSLPLFSLQAATSSHPPFPIQLSFKFILSYKTKTKFFFPFFIDHIFYFLLN